MSRREVKIGRLEVRLRGVAPHEARAAAAGLGRELAERLAAEPVRASAARSVRVERLDAGAHALGGGADAAALRDVLARRIAEAVGAKLGARGRVDGRE
jgi:hypothetical protein